MSTDERVSALELANRLLDEPNADPDDDLRVLARQLLRRTEENVRLQERIDFVTTEAELDAESAYDEGYHEGLSDAEGAI